MLKLSKTMPGTPAGRPWRRRLLLLVCFIGPIYLCLLLAAYFETDRLIFQPPAASYRDGEGIVKIGVAGAAPISAIYLPNPGAEFTLLYSHGNAEDIGEIRGFLESLHAMGFAVIAYDYPGYGTSPGSPTERSARQAEQAAYDFLIHDRHVPAGRIVAFGRSLGAAMAIDLAARRPVGGLIVESAFLSADRVVTRVRLFPFEKFGNLSRIGSVTAPVLVIHGGRDRLIPLWHGEALFDRAKGLKQSLWVETAGHNDLVQKAGPRYREALLKFSRLLDHERRAQPGAAVAVPGNALPLTVAQIAAAPLKRTGSGQEPLETCNYSQEERQL